MKIRNTIATALAMAVIGVTSASAQVYRYNPEHRRPVEHTIHVLESVQAHYSYSGKEWERYNNAITHLRQFGERLHEGGYFDKDKLDQAIGDVQHVVDHNRMDPGARDELARDDNELRRLRQHFDDRYKYPY